MSLQYRSILFDLDSTLFDRKLSVDRFIPILYDALNIKSSLDYFTVLINRLDLNGYASRMSLYDKLTLEFEIKVTKEWFIDFWIDKAWISPKYNDNADNLLKTLKHKGYKTGVITNGSIRSQLTKIKNLGLDTLVDVISISEEIGFTKPSKEIFDRTAEKIGMDNNQCIYIGDNLKNDFEGSKNAGMFGIWYNQKNENTNHDIEKITNLNEVIDYLNK